MKINKKEAVFGQFWKIKISPFGMQCPLRIRCVTDLIPRPFEAGNCRHIPNLRYSSYVASFTLNIVNICCYFVGWAFSRCLTTTPHPINRAGGSIFLVLYSMIILKPAIFRFLLAVVSYNHTLIYNHHDVIRIQPVIYFRSFTIHIGAENLYL